MTRIYLRFALVAAVMGLVSLLLAELVYWANTEDSEEVILRLMRGSAELAAQTVLAAEFDDREKALEELRESFGYQVRLGSYRGLRTVYVRSDDFLPMLHVPLSDGSAELVIGPIPFNENEELQQTLPALIVASLFLSLVIALIAALPLVRRIRSIEWVASRLRQGDFTARCSDDGGDALENLGASMNLMADRLGQLVMDQRDLMRAVAHEVRTPVARLGFRVEMLEAGSVESYEKHASGMGSDLKKLDTLIDELLTYVSFDAFDHERPELRRSTFSLEGAVRQMVADVTELESDIEVEMKFQADVEIEANRMLFDRALENVLRNALKYTNQKIVVSCRRSSTECVIDVQDDGPGIPEGERKNVLKPFFRLKTHEGGKKGTGLGLAIVSRIMRLHDGDFYIVKSPLGGASCQLVWRRKVES